MTLPQRERVSSDDPGGTRGSEAKAIEVPRDGLLDRAGEKRRRVWPLKYIAFAASMLFFPLASIYLFATAIGLRRVSPTEAAQGRLQWILFVVVVAITLIPCMLLGAHLVRRWRREREFRKQGMILDETLLDLTVHAVPYGILSLAMLFEYQKIKDGSAEGMAALAAIMILFIMAELGLVLFSEVREARRVSDDLRQALGEVKTSYSEVRGGVDAVRKQLGTLPWVSELSRLTELSHKPILRPGVGTPSQELEPIYSLERLVNLYRGLLEGSSGENRLLRSVFLREYLREEFYDLSGSLERTSVPVGVRPPFESDAMRHEASFAVTNIGFYARFLGEAVWSLAHESGSGLRAPDNVPCVAVVTSALPTQFWNWPKEGTRAVEYGPIREYREAQIHAVAQTHAKIFRVVIVGDGEETFNTETDLGRSKDLPDLWSHQEWGRERYWCLAFCKSDTEKTSPVRAKAETPPVNADELIPLLRWTAGRRQPSTSEDAFWVTRVRSEDTEAYQFEEIWKTYCRLMHPRRGSGVHSSGFTEIMRIAPEKFVAEFGAGLNRCTDLMFLGTCPATTDDLWDEPRANWSLALMSSMSPSTETMFLTLIHDESRLDQLWERLTNLKPNLGEIIGSSRAGDIASN